MPSAIATREIERPFEHSGIDKVSTELVVDLSSQAVLCLHAEVSLYPKPGLVSPVDSGSHRDMDYQMFLASINSLRGYFGKIAEAGASGAAFSTLQMLGIEAEAQMMRATRGVNTHRGAIFNLGLLCAAAGQLKHCCEQVTPQALGAVIADRWGVEILATGGVKAYAEYSHGQQVEAKYGAHGARQEAVAGFPAARDYGLPAYQAALAETGCRDAAAVQALFAMMARLDDTNILWRAGADGLRYVKAVSKDFLDAGGVSAGSWKTRAIALHHEFVRKNLSPGGAADLLGVTLFMNEICD